jgi:hypothetical protein
MRASGVGGNGAAYWRVGVWPHDVDRTCGGMRCASGVARPRGNVRRVGVWRMRSRAAIAFYAFVHLCRII